MVRYPENWQDAQSGEEQLDYVLYDSELSTTNANTALSLFGSDIQTDGLDQTNMEIRGQLPSSQRFLIKKIAVHFNDVLASTDAENILDRASFELRVNQRRYLTCPLREVMSEKSVIPAGVTQDEQYFMGKTYELENYIMLAGGTPFVVNLETGETAAGASTEITVCLIGELVRRV